MPIKTAANVIVPKRDVDPQVEGELTNLLYRNSRGLHLTGAGAAGLATLLFWQSTHPVSISLWLGCMLAIAAGRAWLARRFAQEELSLAETSRWSQAFQYGNVAAAVGWAFGGLLMYPPGSPSGQMLLTVVMVGVIAIFTPMLVANRKYAVTFALIVMAPLIMRHLGNGSLQSLVAVAILILLFPLLIALTIRSFNQIVEDLQARFAYADLAKELSGEIAVRRQAEHRLLDMANFDQLTNLPNRSLLKDRMDRALAKSQRHKSLVAVLFVDLDRFKHINDSLGHHVGDEVLREIAERLQKTVRQENTVARLSGDEFIIVVEEMNTLDEIRTVARRLLMEVSEPIILEDSTELKLTASIGIAVAPDHGKENDLLLQNADIAMYRAKTQGRNGFQIFTPDMHAEALTRLSRENALRRALENEEFFLAFQLEMHGATQAYVGAEALLRWESPEYGMISPAEFIPLAEETGLIRPLGDWALRAALQQARRFTERFGKDFYTGINLSPRQLEAEDAVEHIEAMIKDVGVDPSAVMFEITETVALSNAHSNLTKLRKLRALGCQLALDDFGTGNSSLTYLKRFPITAVKLDKSFIDNVTMNREDAAIARATIELAQELDLKVIAEGVESREQADWLKDRQCFIMQGYLFSPPLQASQCMDRVAATGKTDVEATPGQHERRET
ncbi:MAG: EAL domain-containing protein [Gammaproteobacteria bacterium]|nr:EAL domain-containing protein [Gammaproteobacteria bacterium]